MDSTSHPPLREKKDCILSYRDHQLWMSPRQPNKMRERLGKVHRRLGLTNGIKPKRIGLRHDQTKRPCNVSTTHRRAVCVNFVHDVSGIIGKVHTINWEYAFRWKLLFLSPCIAYLEPGPSNLVVRLHRMLIMGGYMHLLWEIDEPCMLLFGKNKKKFNFLIIIFHQTSSFGKWDYWIITLFLCFKLYIWNKYKNMKVFLF